MSFLPIFVVAFLAIMAGNLTALTRGRIAARFADNPEEQARLATTLTVTVFFCVFVVFSALMSLFVLPQVLYAAPGPVTVLFPLGLLVLFGVAYLQARRYPSAISRQAAAGWRWGGAPGETEQMWEDATRARSWILALGFIPPLLVLGARVFFYGTLGSEADLPAGMLMG